MNDVIKSVQLEERRLIAELQDNPTYIRLQAARNFLAAYGIVSPFELTQIPTIKENRISNEVKTSNKGNDDPLMKRALIQVEAYLKSNKKRSTAKELVEVIQMYNPEFKTINLHKLSRAMAQSEVFDNIRGAGQGYGLAYWPKLEQKSETIATSEPEIRENHGEETTKEDSKEVNQFNPNISVVSVDSTSHE